MQVCFEASGIGNMSNHPVLFWGSPVIVAETGLCQLILEMNAYQLRKYPDIVLLNVIKSCSNMDGKWDVIGCFETVFWLNSGVLHAQLRHSNPQLRDPCCICPCKGYIERLNSLVNPNMASSLINHNKIQIRIE